MRRLAAFATVAALAAPALAQTEAAPPPPADTAPMQAPPPPSEAAPMPAAPGAGTPGAQGPAPAERHRVTLKERFERANFSHDGRLTREQARGMPFVAHHFDAIDSGHTGYVTLDEIHAYLLAHPRPPRPQAPPPPPAPQ